MIPNFEKLRKIMDDDDRHANQKRWKFPKEVEYFPFSYYKSIVLKFENKVDGVNECQDIMKINIYIS